VNRGYFCKSVEISRDPGAKFISNSSGDLLNLVKCVENRRKFRKCKLNFVGFVVKNPTTFVMLA
jgi:hypothetical protein